MKKLLLVSAIPFMFGGVTLTANAADVFGGETANWYVDAATGSDDNAGSAEAPFASLAKALTVVTDNQVILFTGTQLINEALYPDATISGDGKVKEGGRFTIKGAGTAPDNNVITNDDRRFRFQNSTLTFENVAFKNGVRTGGGEGIALEVRGGSLTLNGCLIEGNESTTGVRGAIGIVDNNARVIDCTFRNNKANGGGGLLVVNNSCEISGCTFEGNEALTNQGGGALKIENANTTSTDCLFAGNTAASGGGAIVVGGNGAKTMTFTECVIRDNESKDLGGGININGQGGKTVTFDRCVIADNVAKEHGGAIQIGNALATVNFYNSTITGNHCNSAGATMFIAGNETATALNIYQTTIRGNYTQSNEGNSGGVRIIGNINVDVTNSVLEGNYCLGGNTYSDICLLDNLDCPITAKNSVIGRFGSGEPTALTNVESQVGVTTVHYPAPADYAGLAEYDREKMCYPILSATSPAATMGNMELNKDIAALAVDQLGTNRTKPYIGAVQLLANEAPTGVEIIEADDDAPVEYYNLQGVRVVNPENGVYIRRQGSKAVKVKI